MQNKMDGVWWLWLCEYFLLFRWTWMMNEVYGQQKNIFWHWKIPCKQIGSDVEKMLKHWPIDSRKKSILSHSLALQELEWRTDQTFFLLIRFIDDWIILIRLSYTQNVGNGMANCFLNISFQNGIELTH